MKVIKNYYATAQCFVRKQSDSTTDPKHHRYLLFVGFDEDTLQLINEHSLHGTWKLLNGKIAPLDFDRESVSNGRELSEITEYTGQVYKRIPPRKTFIISKEDFLEHNLDSVGAKILDNSMLAYGT